jgi:hypothetical protein
VKAPFRKLKRYKPGDEQKGIMHHLGGIVLHPADEPPEQQGVHGGYHLCYKEHNVNKDKLRSPPASIFPGLL